MASRPAFAHGHERPDETPGIEQVFEAGNVLGTLHLPRGSRPRGVALLVHDALGADPRSAAYADQLLATRIAVLDLQQGDGNAEGVTAAVQAVTRDPRLHGLPVALIGFGRGGRLALRVSEGIAAHVLFYPGCAGIGVPGMPAAGHPIALIHGTADDANPPRACEMLAERLGRAGHRVRLMVYQGAGYSWDHPLFGMEERMLLPRPDGPGRIAVAPWPELASMSTSQMVGFLRDALRIGQ